MKRRIVFIAAGLIVVGALVIAYFSQKGTVSVELNALSPVTDGVEVYIARRQYPKPLTPPFTMQLRPGQYQLIALAPGAAELKQEFTIANKQTTRLSLTLTANPTAGAELELTPTTEELARNPLLKLFPHQDANFSATAKFSRDEQGEIVVSEVTITPFLPIPAGQPYDREEVLAAKAQYVQEAKDWLSQNQIPDSTPLVINSII